MASSGMQVAALGRSFTLGMLYDARSDRLLPGLSLWDAATLHGSTVESFQHSSAFQISASDSSRSKTALLDVDASLKASFLSGLVEVSGSAKYLKDRKKFQNQSRVTLQYSATTAFKQLTVTHLSADPRVAGSGPATHLVTGVLYGADAFFVFDSQKLDASEVQDVHGSMEAVVKKIPSFNVAGRAEIQLTEQEKSLVQTFSCTFHGDFVLASNPTTFQDAVRTYVELPKLLGEQSQNAVPVKVWLMPLKNLLPDAPQVLGQLSGGLRRRLEEGLEDLKQMEARCNDCLEDAAGQDFPQIQEDLRRFQKLCADYRSDLQRSAQTRLPSIRQGGEDESALRAVFDAREASPFSHGRLLAWLQSKEREVSVVRSCLEILEGAVVVRSRSQLDREVLAPAVRHILCFVFTSLESADPCLDRMARYLDANPQATAAAGDHDVPWYYSDEVFTRIREKARTFHGLYYLRKNSQTLRFLVAAMQNDTHPGASIYHYQDGVLVTEDFSPPDVPDVTKIRDRRDVFWYAFSPTVDEDTVSDDLTLGGDLMATAWNMPSSSTFPIHPKPPRRFHQPQFLCQQRLTGRHYWEVAWDDDRSVDQFISVGVAYENMDRRSMLGSTDDSWALCHSVSPREPPSLCGVHAGLFCRWAGPWPPACARIGLFLDWPAGSLSFYAVSADTLSHFFTFHTSFTEPLFPAAYLGCRHNYVSLRPAE